MLTHKEITTRMFAIIMGNDDQIIAYHDLIEHINKLLSQKENLKEDLNQVHEIKLRNSHSLGKFTLLDILLFKFSVHHEQLIIDLLNHGAQGNNTTILIDLLDPLISMPLKEQLFFAYKEPILHPLYLDSQQDHYLHWVARNNHKIDQDHLKFLLKIGLPLDARNGKNETAAQVAFSQKNYELLLYLIESGADLSVTNEKGEKLSTLIQQEIAEQKPKQDELLKRAVATVDLIVTSEVFSEQLKHYGDPFPGKNELEKFQNLLKSSKDKQRLFSDPVIITYLARGNFAIDESGEPIYTEVEKLFYQAARSSEDVKIPYRTDPEGFYLTGTDNNTNVRLTKVLENEIESADRALYSIIIPPDLYSLPKIILDRAVFSRTLTSKFSYLFSATIKDNHIYVTLSLLNLEKQKPHFTIILNSWSSNAYFDAMKSRLDMPYEAAHLPSPPVLDGSVNIQVNADDLSCSLYTQKLLQTLYRIITTSPDLREKLENLPENSSDAEKDWQVLCPQLHRRIKEELPEFFQPVGEEFVIRPYRERKRWILERRWEVGQQFVIEEHEKIVAEAYRNLKLLTQLEARLNQTDVNLPSFALYSIKKETVHCTAGVEYAGKKKKPPLSADSLIWNSFHHLTNTYHYQQAKIIKSTFSERSRDTWIALNGDWFDAKRMGIFDYLLFPTKPITKLANFLLDEKHSAWLRAIGGVVKLGALISNGIKGLLAGCTFILSQPAIIAVHLWAMRKEKQLRQSMQPLEETEVTSNAIKGFSTKELLTSLKLCPEILDGKCKRIIVKEDKASIGVINIKENNKKAIDALLTLNAGGIVTKIENHFRKKDNPDITKAVEVFDSMTLTS